MPVIDGSSDNWMAPRYPAEVVHLRGRVALQGAEINQLQAEVERLREERANIERDIKQSADRREWLEDEVERLREALQRIEAMDYDPLHHESPRSIARAALDKDRDDNLHDPGGYRDIDGRWRDA